MFSIGQRVRISPAGIEAGIQQKSGIVQETDRPEYPMVLWEGRKTPSCYHADCLEPEPLP
ncbi:hypothetical protein [Mesorhizobium sp.]|uniref:hypothetical protein n=1 Tax=Mesorhizobium sp. TaxID=1871066 RepID=UPI000FE4F16B|nr:hypothetical protein [Mesorhizobium sp.]RWE37414.1 MAG: hypothetical protein EOS77_02220 [Mesorhizobium sp.]